MPFIWLISFEFCGSSLGEEQALITAIPTKNAAYEIDLIGIDGYINTSFFTVFQYEQCEHRNISSRKNNTLLVGHLIMRE